MSTGNDIVALDAIDGGRTILPRFYSKILSSSEQALWSQHEFPGLAFSNFVWLLWSIKESAYKYRQRIEPDLIFSPIKIIVQELITETGFFRAVVHSGSGMLYARSTINEEYIASVVSKEKGFEKTRWGVASIGQTGYAEQSASARVFLLDALNSLLPAGDGTLRIGKRSGGCPVLYKGKKESGIPISLAHHGHFVSWSFRL